MRGTFEDITREREREKEREIFTQFGEGGINGTSNRGKVGLTLKLDEILKSSIDL